MEARRPITICVDLDGTLVRTDTLVEALLRMLQKPGNWLAVTGSLLYGRAGFKGQITALASIDTALLPYEHKLVDYLRTERTSGRLLVLATAADREIADGVNAYLGLFDEVIASDGVHNIKGQTKADALAKRFGEGNFTYVGNSRSDLHIWQRAGSAILVNVSDRLADEVRQITTIEHRIHERPSRGFALLKTLRPHQWLKNMLVFVPILTANALQDHGAWLAAAALFVAFSATASSIYIVNDVTDLTADRRHPRKRRRPLASGDLPIVVGLAAAPMLLVIGLLASLGTGTAHILVLYAACSLAYSIKLKELPLIDIFLLATLYTFRLIGGADASGYPLSPWLLAFSSFLFFSLATIKRVGELMDLTRRGERGGARRAYSTQDVSILQTMGLAASFVSSTVLALFVQSDSVVARYTYPKLLWIIVALMLFWQCRLWLATARGYMLDDPIVYAARDWVSRTIALIVVGVFLLARGFRSPAG
jgi:4-hydroxybenzoate polyprenyltransferase/phosphoserine phosphatase